VVTACWSIIGVRGDGSCPELERHVHCRNCPVYSAAAQALLDRPLSSADLAERTARFAAPKLVVEGATQSLLIFRIGHELLALPSAVVKEIADVRPIHSLPHRRTGGVLGVVNIRGELVVCVSLDRLLGIERTGAAPAKSARSTPSRLLVLRREGISVVCPADEVHGLHRVATGQLQELPASVGRSTSRHSSNVVAWQGRSVGLLDDQLVFQSLKRSLA
jgi:chemotaxis-related protein WspD